MPQDDQPAVAESSAAYSVGQMRRIAAIYEFLARALPTEGRDYGVKFSFKDKNDPSSVSVSFNPYTKIGKLWCDYCTEVLKQKST